MGAVGRAVPEKRITPPLKRADGDWGKVMADQWLNQRIKALRQQQGMTLRELSRKTGVTEATISRWETGRIANMRRDKIAVLAEALGTTPAYLMGLTDDPQSAPLAARDRRDIEGILAEARQQLENEEGLMFDGKPASQEAIESILAAMDVGLQLAKQKNREKYGKRRKSTPYSRRS